MNAVDVLKWGHATVGRTIDGLPTSEWETGGVCGVWSVKDIIGHLAAFEHLLFDVLSSFLGDNPTPTLDRYFQVGPMRFNDVEADARKSLPAEEVLAEYNDEQARTMDLAARITPEIWVAAGTLPWYGLEYSLDDYIVYTYYGHKREHCAQIMAFRNHIEAWPVRRRVRGGRRGGRL